MLPVFNESASINACLESLAAQDYSGPWEILVADGGSTDDTIDLVGQWSDEVRIRVFDNPDRLQSRGLNLLASVSNSEVIVRADAHSTYAPDYLSRSVDALGQSDATAVGGPMRPAPGEGFARSVAAAYRSRLGIGPAPFHHAQEPVLADTVYLGGMRRHDYLELGGMRTLPSRVAEDADFYYRMRARGGKVLVDPAIVSSYKTRESPSQLWRQFYRYGLGKADMLFINGEFPSLRPLAPLGLVLGLVIGLTIWIALQTWWPILALLSVWVVALVVAGRAQPGTVLAIAIMHLSYGLGLLRGLLRSPRSVRASVR